MGNTQLIFLAAGSSTRMGSPKQLLPWGRQTLIEYQVQTLLKTGYPVNVILGAYSDKIMPVIENYNINVFINKNWEFGMGSSIAVGIRSLLKLFPDSKGVLFALLDQPLVPSEHFLRMLKVFQSGKSQIIVSGSASGWQGVPVLFDKTYFEELKKLKREEGAKNVIQKYKNNVITLDCGEMLEDMDTPESYHRLLNVFLNK